jgi:hypothetical protein
MKLLRCEHCHRQGTVTPDGLACGCQRLAREEIVALLLAWEAIPEPWPVLDLIERLERIRPHTAPR